MDRFCRGVDLERALHLLVDAQVPLSLHSDVAVLQDQQRGRESLYCACERSRKRQNDETKVYRNYITLVDDMESEVEYDRRSRGEECTLTDVDLGIAESDPKDVVEGGNVDIKLRGRVSRQFL